MLGGLGRMFTGESLFMATYTAQRDGQQIALASTFPGSILVLEVRPGQEYICQKSAFLCATPGVQLSVEFTRSLGGGFFGGEGFMLQRLSGTGQSFLRARLLLQTTAHFLSQPRLRRLQERLK